MLICFFCFQLAADAGEDVQLGETMTSFRAKLQEQRLLVGKEMLANGRLAAALGGNYEIKMEDEIGVDGKAVSSDKKFTVRFKRGPPSNAPKILERFCVSFDVLGLQKLQETLLGWKRNIKPSTSSHSEL